VFRLLAGYRQPSLDLDGGDYLPGERVEVRVEVSDRTGRTPSCAPDQRECDYVSACPGRLTWEIEYR
jgi:hypothetical protein